jgi:branched-chain amino acid transport system permease protein
VTPQYFGAFASLTFLAFAYLGGIASVSGAVVAGIIAPNGLNFNFLENILHIDPGYATLIGGIGLIVTAVRNPEGIAGTPRLVAIQKAERKARKEALLRQQSESNRENEGAT